MNPNLVNKLKALKKASHVLMISSEEDRNTALKQIREVLLKNTTAILKANQKDLKKIKKDNPLFDRLELNKDRIQEICSNIDTIISLEDPLNRVIEKSKRPSGILLKKVSIPLGCIGIIYEARPNVTIDVTCLCLKSGNSVLLRGGSSSYESNKTIVTLISEALKLSKIPSDSIQLLDPDRELVREMMKAHAYLDLIIPRGGKHLIQLVRDRSTVPIIETGASVVHTYVDKSANIEMAVNIIHNEKTRRPSVCNSVDTVLVNKIIAQDFLYKLAKKFKNSKTVFHCDQISFELLKDIYPTAFLKDDANQYYDHEFLSLEINIKIIENIEEAITHIRKHSLNHSESIITENHKNAEKFQREVDAACVYVNTSTAFSDGAQFGLGAEIGISTQKLHARGPMGLQALTSYKWLINSEGKTRD